MASAGTPGGAGSRSSTSFCVATGAPSRPTFSTGAHPKPFWKTFSPATWAGWFTRMSCCRIRFPSASSRSTWDTKSFATPVGPYVTSNPCSWMPVPVKSPLKNRPARIWPS